MVRRGAVLAGLLAALFASRGQAQQASASGNPGIVTVESDGVVRIPSMEVPLSPLASDVGRQDFLTFAQAFAKITTTAHVPPDPKAINRQLDELLMGPGVAKLRAAFPVNIHPANIGGVPTDIVEPVGGPSSKRRVLINLHGGAFLFGAGLGGQMESIPIASLGGFKVVTVNYRQGPENHFPAASQDVAAVYRELLRQYPAGNIGIYGCSAGAILTAESLAWFQQHDLPTPGAAGMFGGGGIAAITGDSAFLSQAVGGMNLRYPVPSRAAAASQPPNGYFAASKVELDDPLVSPAEHPEVLAKFPPSLLITSTRDMMLSPVIATHTRLVKAGVSADLHVFEGMPHCWFAQPIINAAQPETREAWSAIVKFFDRELGR